MEWPSCRNCREDEGGECSYEARSEHGFSRPPADLELHGCCGYWHGTNDATLRQRCRELIAEIEQTRPPVDGP